MDFIKITTTFLEIHRSPFELPTKTINTEVVDPHFGNKSYPDSRVYTEGDRVIVLANKDSGIPSLRKVLASYPSKYTVFYNVYSE